MQCRTFACIVVSTRKSSSRYLYGRLSYLLHVFGQMSSSQWGLKMVLRLKSICSSPTLPTLNPTQYFSIIPIFRIYSNMKQIVFVAVPYPLTSQPLLECKFHKDKGFCFIEIHPRCPEQCVVYSRHLISVHWMSEWMVLWLSNGWNPLWKLSLKNAGLVWLNP